MSVIRDITNALLGQTFLNYILESFEDTVLTASQAKKILTEIACSSVMRLDTASMDKLVDLMVMIFKWQMYLLNNPEDLLNLTMKHLDCIGKIYPHLKKMVMIDEAKSTILTEWNCLEGDHKYTITRIINRWLSPFTTKISLLIRAKLQNGDGSFLDKMEAQNNSFFNYYHKNNGENIYEIVTNFSHQENPSKNSQYSFEFDQLFNQLNMEVEKCNLLCSFPAAFKARNSSESVNRTEEIEIEEEVKPPLEGPKEKIKVQMEYSSNITNLLEELKLNSENEENSDVVENEFSELLDMLNK